MKLSRRKLLKFLSAVPAVAVAPKVLAALPEAEPDVLDVPTYGRIYTVEALPDYDFTDYLDRRINESEQFYVASYTERYARIDNGHYILTGSIRKVPEIMIVDYKVGDLLSYETPTGLPPKSYTLYVEDGVTSDRSQWKRAVDKFLAHVDHAFENDYLEIGMHIADKYQTEQLNNALARQD